MFFPEYDRLDAVAMAGLVRQREISPEELLRAAVERTESRNPELNCVIATMYDQAKEQCSAGVGNSIVAGVPFLIKDAGLQYAGVRNRVGSRVFDRLPPAESHSTLTQKYLSAGLVIFGRTSMPELGNSGTTEPVAHGPCRNPWDVSRSPGGSSGGSAAAVAARLSPMASGGDGGGSIRNPASACGLVGLKPTRIRVTLGPQIFEGNSGLTVVHGLTISVRDCAALLDISTGPEPGDAYVAPAPIGPYLDEVGKSPGKLCIGFHRMAHHEVEIHPECVKAVEDAASFCESLGHNVEEFNPGFNGQLFQEINLVLWSTNNLLALQSVVDNDEDLIDHPSLEWITGRIADLARSFSAVDYMAARDKMHQLSRSIAQPFKKYDLVLSPVVREPPWKLGVYETGFDNPYSYFSRVYDYSPFCWPYNVSGQPAISVPFHWTPEGLPVGVMFAGQYGDEATLLRLASQLEGARPWAHKVPEMIKNSQ